MLSPTVAGVVVVAVAWAAPDRLVPALWVGAAGSVALLGLAALVAGPILRRASAAARHDVWLLAFAGSLLLPVLAALLPAWRVLPRVGPVLELATDTEADEVALEIDRGPSSWSGEPSAAVPPGEPNATARTTAAGPANHAVASPDNGGGEAVDRRASPGAHDEPSTGPPAPAGDPKRSTSVSAGPVAPHRLAGRPSTSIATTTTTATVGGGLASWSWPAWAAAAWAAGSLVVLVRVLAGHLSLRSLRRRCTPVVKGEWADLLDDLRASVGVRGPVELLACPSAPMPMTWGLWRPRLLLPSAAADWPADRMQDVLRHELGHVRRRDCLTQLLAHVGCAAYWFNPLAWLAARRLQVERERACDDLVLTAAGADAPAYARGLVHSVALVQQAASAAKGLPAAGTFRAAVAMARPSTLEERVKAILNPLVDRLPPTPRRRLAVAVLTLAGLAPLAALRAQPAPATAPPAAVDPAGAASSSASASATADRPQATRASADAATRPTTRRTPPTSFGGGGEAPAPRRTGFGGSARSTPTLGEGPTCTFDATIYEFRIPVDQIGRLDVDALAAAAAANAEAFEKALAAVGTAKPQYRVTQSVRLSGDTVTMGTEQPFVVNSRMTEKGQAINTIQYQDVGAVFNVVGKVSAADTVDLDLGIQVSGLSSNGVPIAEKVTAPAIRKATLSHKGPVTPRKAFVLLSIDGGVADQDGKAVAYVGRVTIGEPQPAGK